MTFATLSSGVYTSCVVAVRRRDDTGGSPGFEWGFLVVLAAMALVAVIALWRSLRR
jgi:hypothetical protein